MVVDAEKVQELLDAGMTRNRIASKLGVHHSKIDRIVKKKKLEEYVPFDSEDDRKHLVQNFEWLWEEDELENLLWKAFDGEVLLDCKYNEDAVMVGKYVKEQYGDLKSYLAKKDFSRVMTNVRIRCICEKEFSLDDWHLDGSKLWGLCATCPACRSNSQKQYVENNPEKIFANNQNRRELVEALPYNFGKASYVECAGIDHWQCALSKNTNNTTIDHFIAVATGHGGTYLENSVLLSRKLNSAKNSYNPFVWITRYGDYAENFKLIIARLSSHNCLTPEEYENFVNWCYENPRNVDEIKADQRHSIEIWRESTGLQFPLPAYTATYRVINGEEAA